MMGPDYTHWHGTYEIARNFYSEFIPELRELVERGMHSEDSELIAAAEALDAKIDEVLNSDDHKWFLARWTQAKRRLASGQRRSSRTATRTEEREQIERSITVDSDRRVLHGTPTH